MASRTHRGFWSSFQYVTLIMGHLLALTVPLVLQKFLSEAELRDWGWRVPFAIGALAAIVTFFLRRNMEETAAFTHQ